MKNLENKNHITNVTRNLKALLELKINCFKMFPNESDSSFVLWQIQPKWDQVDKKDPWAVYLGFVLIHFPLEKFDGQLNLKTFMKDYLEMKTK